DFGRRDGLFIGHDGQRFQRLQRKLQRRFQRLDEAADGVVILGLGGEAVAAGNFADFDTAPVAGVVGHELVKKRAEVVAEGFFAGLGLLRGFAGELFLVVGRGGFGARGCVGFRRRRIRRRLNWSCVIGSRVSRCWLVGGGGFRVIAQKFGVEGVGVSCLGFGGFVEVEQGLLRALGVELRLAFFAKQANELGQG